MAMKFHREKSAEPEINLIPFIDILLVVVIFLIAGIATPSPDVFSQLLLGTPLMGLYVVGIYVAKRVEKNRDNE